MTLLIVIQLQNTLFFFKSEYEVFRSFTNESSFIGLRFDSFSTFSLDSESIGVENFQYRKFSPYPNDLLIGDPSVWIEINLSRILDLISWIDFYSLTSSFFLRSLLIFTYRFFPGFGGFEKLIDLWSNFVFSSDTLFRRIF